MPPNLKSSNPDIAVRPEKIEDLLKSSFRTMALYEYFTDMKRPLNIGEIASGINIPQSSASTMVKSLLDSGYLEKDMQSRTYRPSLRTLMLNDWIKKDNEKTLTLIDAIPTLCAQIDETVILAKRNNIYSQYVYVAHTKSHNEAHDFQYVQTGSLRPLVCSATGWALLSHTSEDEIGKLIRRTMNETENDYWKSTAKSALENIRTAKEKGYAYSSGPSAKGTSGIAITLQTDTTISEYVLGVAGSSAEIKEKKTFILTQIMTFLRTQNWKCSYNMFDVSAYDSD